MLSGRGLCDELITRPEESYRLWYVIVCDLETSRIGAPYIYDISNLRVKEGNCTAQSGCSLSYAHYVLQLKWTCASPSCANWYNGQWPVLYTLAE